MITGMMCTPKSSTVKRIKSNHKSEVKGHEKSCPFIFLFMFLRCFLLQAKLICNRKSRRSFEMARGSTEIKYEIKEFISPLKESDKHDWCKAVVRMSWNDGPTQLNIRNMNMAINRMGSGISLSDEEADRLTDILLERDYGSLDTLISAVERKRSRFTIASMAADVFADEDDDGPLVIKIDL